MLDWSDIARARGLRARGLAVAVALGTSACSSCEQANRPQGSGETSASVAAAGSETPPAPPVALSPTVASQALAPWKGATRSLSPVELAALLPLTEGGRIQLHDAGLEPRTVWRHTLEPGAASTLLLELDLGMTVQLDGETTIPPVPALTVEVALETLSAKDGIGEIQLTIAKADVRRRGDEDIDKEVMEQIAPLVKKLPGIRAVMRLTAQGIRANSPTAPPETPEELRQLWTSVAEAVSDAIVAFPAEPIGAGARWTLLDRQARAGVVMLRKTDVTLLDITGDELRLRGDVVEAAIAGSAHDPALPKEIALEVLEGVTVGKRRHTLRRRELWPLASSTELSSDLVLRATATAGESSDTKTSKVKITQILRAVRADAAAALPNAFPSEDDIDP